MSASIANSDLLDTSQIECPHHAVQMHPMADQKEHDRRMKGKSEAIYKKHSTDYVNNDRAQAARFIKMWDKEVDSPSYDKLLRL